MPRVGKRKEIISAAASLFAERGFTAVSARDVAEIVGVSPANIFYHFTNKEELFKAAMHWVSDEVIDRRGILLTSDIDDRTKLKAIVYNIVAAHTEHLSERRMLLKVLIDSDYERLALFVHDVYADQHKAIANLISRVAPQSDPYQILYLFMTIGLGYPTLYTLFDTIKPLTEVERSPQAVADMILALTMPHIKWGEIGLDPANIEPAETSYEPAKAGPKASKRLRANAG